MELKFEVFGKIAKPITTVFKAVYDPHELSGYFTTGGASGPLDEGTTVMWDFADFPGAFPVHVRKVERDRLMVLEWQAADGDYLTQVRMEFEPIGENATLLRISESGWQETAEGLKNSYGNCMGWTQMLCCLKVYVEHDINLRAFFF